ncbi:MAG: DUF1129 family protein [Lysinibacillus sp.]
MDVQQLVKSNNERKKMLSKSNLKYYEDLLVYIRLASLKEEKAKEEVLMEMLEHLIEAEQNGVEAEKVFGKTPKQLADDIIDSLPAEKKSSAIYFMVETIILLVGVYIASTGLFNAILKENYELHVGSALICLAALIGGFLVMLPILIKQLQKSSFSKSKMPFVISSITMTVYIFGIATLVVFIPAIGQPFNVTPWMMLGVGVALLIIYFSMKFFRTK